ncbi:ureidoglycolate lyase [Acuticoccus sp.]|uniref:ureidoglycolate lyase n=1 Tax=Acuticoccus sp. TaxID=1904378 RepID=UPI003B52635B
MQTLKAEPLGEAAFAPFGEVLTPPGSPGRTYYSGALASLRPGAAPSLSLTRVEVATALPHEARRMERHEFSSQSFVPLGDVPFLVMVAPDAPSGGPDLAEARAFVASGGVGVTYGANVWHHPLSVLAAPASFAVVMWLDGGPTDEEFVDIEPRLVEA